MESVEYTKYFCEENIYQLAELFQQKNKECFVCFISNKMKKAPVYFQKEYDDSNLVVWDYHVILISKEREKFMVYDFDTKLNQPESFSTYVKLALREVEGFEKIYRVIKGEDYVNYFSSNRSHMKKDGKFVCTPPKYPNIMSAKSENDNTFPNYINMVDDSNLYYGKLYNLNDLIDKFQI